MRIIKYIFLMCLFLATQAFAKIDVKIQPNPVVFGNPVELIFSSDSSFSGLPDLTKLQQDFVIGGQQQRQSSSWVNGVGQTTYELAYTLFPNKAGKITIPEFVIGKETTTTQTLTVLDKTNAGGKPVPSQEGLEMTVSCEKTQIYPQQMLGCTVQIIDPIGIRNGQIIPPSGNDFTWHPTSNIQSFTTTRQGRPVQVLEQAFVFNATSAGEVNIPAFVFQGNAVFDTTPQRSNRISSIMDLMFMSIGGSATRPVSTISKPFSITVLPIPSDWKGWWLPSTDVSLTETYQMPQTIHVGESIERTVVLSVKGLNTESLPVPTLSTTPQIKVYPGVETRKETADGSALTVTFTIVPIQAGEVSLPAITVPWFDTNNRLIRSAVVPERTVFVQKGDIVPPVQTPSQPTIQPPQNDTLQTPVTPTKIDWMFWLILGAIIFVSFGLGILGTILFIRHKTSDTTKKSNKNKKEKPLPDLYPF